MVETKLTLESFLSYYVQTLSMVPFLVQVCLDLLNSFL